MHRSDGPAQRMAIAGACLVAALPCRIAGAQTAAPGRFVATFSNGASVELIGVSPAPSNAQSWRGPDGLPLDAAPYQPIRAVRNVWESPMLREICWRWRGADLPSVETSGRVTDNTNGWGPIEPADGDGRLINDLKAVAVPYTVIRPTGTVRFTISYRGSHWQPCFQTQGGGTSSHVSHPQGEEVTGVTFDKARPMDGGTFVVMGYKLLAGDEVRLVAIDADGKRHVGRGEFGGSLLGVNQLAVKFADLQPMEVRSWVVERRLRVSETVEFRNVSLDPQTLTAVQIVPVANDGGEPAPAPVQSPRDANQHEQIEFGAEGEVVLDGDFLTPDYIDFDAGAVLAPDDPRSVGTEWLHKQGVDAFASAGRDLRGIVGFDLIAVRAGPEAWDEPEKLPEHLRGARASNSVPIEGGEPHTTYYFQTREGARGVLQIVEVIPDEAVRIRYKLVNTPPKAD